MLKPAKTNCPPSRRKSPAFAPALFLLITFALTSCSSFYSQRAASQRQLYQPPILHLKAGVPIQTAEGTYTPQVDEVWHSAARFNEVERQAQNLAAALQQATAK